eukprot:INCI9407.1.p1 GENE.INCI9407.1~~INCI9407.1.p1  ORF type:complete len:362 (-),score=59.76 INCI9407.1:127-1212(-)
MEDTPHAKAKSPQARSRRLVAFRFSASAQAGHDPTLNTAFVALSALRDSVGNCTIEAEPLCLPVTMLSSARLVSLQATGSTLATAPTLNDWSQVGLPPFVFHVSQSQLAQLGLASATPAAILRLRYFRFSAQPCTVESGSGTNDLLRRKWACDAFDTGLSGGPESIPDFSPVETGVHASTKLLLKADDRGTERGGVCLLLHHSQGQKPIVSHRCFELRLKKNQGVSTFRCTRLLPHRDQAAEAAKNSPDSGLNEDVHVFLQARYNPTARSVIVSAEAVTPFESTLRHDSDGETTASGNNAQVPFISVPLAAKFLSHPRNLELLDLPEAQRELARAACDQVHVAVVGSFENRDKRLELRRAS